ncbi:MAG: HU family DNA-binding protein [Cyanobacteria bacterium REEB65]|nr:HU family DNA-binding protein [Cyanobacteria bacterium REEB65]
MNKEDLVAQVSRKTNVPKKVADTVVNGLFDAIGSALGSAERVTIVGFGTFDVKERQERTGRNPRTGEPIKIQARRVATFMPGKSLRERLGDEE